MLIELTLIDGIYGVNLFGKSFTRFSQRLSNILLKFIRLLFIEVSNSKLVIVFDDKVHFHFENRETSLLGGVSDSYSFVRFFSGTLTLDNNDQVTGMSNIQVNLCQKLSS